MVRKTRFLTISLLLLTALAALSATEARADTLNLTDFGAVGDGITDDGPALQSEEGAATECRPYNLRDGAVGFEE